MHSFIVAPLHQARIVTSVSVAASGFLVESATRAWRTKMPDLDRRHFFGAAAATFAASQLGLLVFPRRLEAMTEPRIETPTDVARQTGSASDIRPFRVSFQRSSSPSCADASKRQD